MIRKFISQVDGAEFQYRFNGINLELKLDGCDWSDFIPMMLKLMVKFILMVIIGQF